MFYWNKKNYEIKCLDKVLHNTHLIVFWQLFHLLSKNKESVILVEKNQKCLLIYLFGICDKNSQQKSETDCKFFNFWFILFWENSSNNQMWESSQICDKPAKLYFFRKHFFLKPFYLFRRFSMGIAINSRENFRLFCTVKTFIL